MGHKKDSFLRFPGILKAFIEDYSILRSILGYPDVGKLHTKP